MKTFDFVCDARVSLTVTAATEGEARKQWDDFCMGVNRADDFMADKAGVPSFYLCLAHEEPEVEEVRT